MTHLVFFEKPGCGGNARQRATLEAAGHTLDADTALTLLIQEPLQIRRPLMQRGDNTSRHVGFETAAVNAWGGPWHEPCINAVTGRLRLPGRALCQPCLNPPGEHHAHLRLQMPGLRPPL